MTTLKFVGTDYRDLLDILIQAVQLAKTEGVRPDVEVNGKNFAYYDLLKVADMLPDEDLQPHHETAANEMFVKRQRLYRRTGYNLAHKANALDAKTGKVSKEAKLKSGR